MPIFGQTVDLLTRGLDYSAERHKLLANNVANAETPGYKRQDVTFDQMLAEARERLPLNRTHVGHLPGDDRPFPARMTEFNNTIWRNDQNNVDIDAEMAKVAQNNIYYSYLTRQVSDNLGRLGLVARRGGES